MVTNIERFRKDLDALLESGDQLENAMQYECTPKEFIEAAKVQLKGKAKEFIKGLPSFCSKYQQWYSEALALIRQLLPDRVDDFTRHYLAPKGRKEINFESYRIEDYLQGLRTTRGIYKEVVVDTSAGIPHFRQQLAILRAANARFESSLFEIRQLVQADLLDSEIEAAEVLEKHKFLRAAGALAGVVLEKHLSQVCKDHNSNSQKKNPSISDYNESLKANNIVDVPQWRYIQHLADIRNLCDHDKTKEPAPDQINDLLIGVKKILKSVF